MSNISKMKHLIAESEHWQSEIVSMEQQQEAQIRAARPSRRLGSNTEQHMIYQVGKALADNPWYVRAIGKRDRAVARATMYGIAAVALRETP